MMFDNYENSATEFVLELRSLQRRAKRAKVMRNNAAMNRYIAAKSAKIGATIPCPTCNTKFAKKRRDSTFCSPECCQRFRMVRQRRISSFQVEQARHVAMIAAMTPEELEVLVATTRTIPVGHRMQCVYCGREFTKGQAGQIFCSRKRHKCRERFRQMHRER